MENFCVVCMKKRDGKFCNECGRKLVVKEDKEKPEKKPFKQKLFSVESDADLKKEGKFYTG